MSNILEMNNISKAYVKAGQSIDVIEGISLSLVHNESIAIMGESGAGKSTLLQVMGGLLSPTQGSLHIDGHDIYGIGDQKRAKLRNANIGFVFQFHYLLPEFSALENVCMPSLVAKKTFQKKRAFEILEKVGLAHRTEHKPSELSGGEQQRVAIARAMMMSPKILLADEPTGNLDQKTSERVSDVMFSMMADQGALVLVTHSERLAQKADKVYRLTKGELILEKSST